jgi:short subunit dehydrogenase-like uncharacterized protein
MNAAANSAPTRQWLLYGATGYTGSKIAQQAVKRGLRPILGGRGDGARTLAADLGLPVRMFSLDDAAAVRGALDGVHVVLHCAGPFSATAAPMIDACLATGVHYLDITGEIAVFELAAGRDAAARERRVVLCPGVGFDVVPTDCLAAALHVALPDATHLCLGFDTDSPLSAGTVKSMVEGLAHGGKVRRAGQIVDVPFAYAVRQIDFGRGTRTAMTIPWGDVSTAFHTTGIADIDCFMATPPTAAKIAGRLNWSRPLLRRAPVQHLLKRLVDRRVHGPSEQQLAKLSTWVWGEVRNARGDVRVARLKTANGYALTIDSALAVTQHLLDQASTDGGFYTPSRLCGRALVERLPGSSPITISQA